MGHRARRWLRPLALSALLAAGTAAARGRAPSPYSSETDGPFVAFRYDTGRVVFVVERLDDGVVPALGGLPERAAPEARLSDMHLRRTDLKTVPGAAEIAGQHEASDRWWVDTGRERVRARIELLVPATIHCEAGLAAIAAVAPEDRPRFDRVREKYFLVQRDTGREPPPPGPIGLSAPVPPLADDERRGIEERLKDALAGELARVRAREWYDRLATPRWRTFDEQLARGAGDLRYDTQMLRGSPDSVPRLYVRASWSIDRRIVFLMSAWIRRGARLNTEAAFSRPSEFLRMREFDGTPLTREWLGLLLNVFDRDGDGWAEILITSWGYESAAVELFEYSESGPQPTGIIHAYGC